MRHAFARQFPRRFVGALCSRSVLAPTIGSTTRLDLVFDVLESHFPAACHRPPLGLRYRIRGALDGTRAFSWKVAEELSSANSGTRRCLLLPRQSSDSASLEIQKITGHLEFIRGGVLLCSAWINALLPVKPVIRPG
jgi:hypothetical protein